MFHTGGALQGLFLSLEQDAPGKFSLSASAWELVFEGRPTQEGETSVWMVPRKGSISMDEED